MFAFSAALFPVIIIVALGRFIAWRGVIAPDGWRAIERISYFLLFPALIIRVLAKAPFESAPWALAGTLIAAQCILGLTGLLRPSMRKRPNPATGSIIQSNVRWNTFVALSIAGSLYGVEGLALVAIAAAAMIPTANILSVLALTRFANNVNGTTPNVIRDLSKNPLIIACVIGGFLNVTGFAPTGVADKTLEIMGQSVIALGLLTAGAGVDLSALRRAGPRTLFWSVARLLSLPLLVLSIGLALSVTPMHLAIGVIAASTPTATNCYILARQLGGDAPLSANLIAVQTVLAAITMPAVYALMLWVSAT
ncbi:AEC family transporter [Fretibacter rubidus]|uniref:AEC family transporter n=1 Tax=Fretibacter rubidus TaxID=570162 RepID=UPI00352BA311